MDREMRQMLCVVGACWLGAISLVVLGLLLAVFGGTAAVRMFLFVILGVALANVMLMALLRVYTRLRCELPIVGGVGVVMGCSLLLLPSTTALPSDGMGSEGFDSAQVARALPGDGEQGRVIRRVLVGPMPGGYGVIEVD
ncbi:MAG: hypothetical protein KDA29_07100 [Phycisphaerales bacterium]|nr:hypothetical protein [Phycisphaerales bacterium]